MVQRQSVHAVPLLFEFGAAKAFQGVLVFGSWQTDQMTSWGMAVPLEALAEVLGKS
jgi:hypothetical protein